MGAGLRLLVCGGRNYSDYREVTRCLGAVHRVYGVSLVIHGGARGADSLAGEWATLSGVPVELYPANWSEFGSRAGPIRNAEMLRFGKPDVVVAFPGGPGTRHMVGLARRVGLTVWLV